MLLIAAIRILDNNVNSAALHKLPFIEVKVLHLVDEGSQLFKKWRVTLQEISVV